MERTEKRDSPKRVMQFMFKPTYSCNLACRYCHIHGLRDSETSIITQNQCDKLFMWILKYAQKHNVNHIDILWHGGEPLLVKPDMMDKIICDYTALFNHQGIECSNSIQSNLLLLDDERLDVIKQHFGGAIGFSYDYLSTDRCFKDGRDASAEIWEKAVWAKREGLDVGAITQITSENASCIDGLYHHFSKDGISFKFSRLRSTDSYISALSDCDYFNAVKRLFDIWVNDKSQSIRIANFVEYIQMLVSGRSHSCCHQPQCNILSFASDGRITFCDREERGCETGNYKKDTPELIDSRIARLRLTVGVTSVCKLCQFYSLCNGGCLMNRISGWHTHECGFTREILTYIASYLSDHGYDLYIK